MSDSPNIAIIGAGPCGLGCARELAKLGHERWTVFERADHPAGLAGSVVDPQGFTWDFGGHVVFSHYGEFDKLLEEEMGDDVYSHERSSYIRFSDRWIPYPFQNNLRYLPPEEAYECILGLIEAYPTATSAKHYARIVEEHALLRRLIGVAGGTVLVTTPVGGDGARRRGTAPRGGRCRSRPGRTLIASSVSALFAG